MQYTSIHLPDLSSYGIMRQGVFSKQDMCDLLRAHAKRLSLKTDDPDGVMAGLRMLTAADTDFHIQRYMNKNRRRNVQVLQEGRFI